MRNVHNAFLIALIFDDSDAIGFILTIFSAIITVCFEVYE